MVALVIEGMETGVGKTVEEKLWGIERTRVTMLALQCLRGQMSEKPFFSSGGGGLEVKYGG
jgi:hypothetical protein